MVVSGLVGLLLLTTLFGCLWLALLAVCCFVDVVVVYGWVLFPILVVEFAELLFVLLLCSY